MMKLTKDILRGETGSALVLSLLIMMVLAIMSLAAVNATNVGLKGTGIYKNYQQTLYLADGGTDFGFSVIERAVANGLLIDAEDTGNANVTIADVNDLENEISAISVDDPDEPDVAPDATVIIAGQPVNIDIDFLSTMPMPGTASEFGSRYEGIGAGGAGGFALIYKVQSNYQVSASNQSSVRIHFRCVEGGGRCL